MFSLVTVSNQRCLAQKTSLERMGFGVSTSAGIVKPAGVGDYPRTALACTIRTPSPDGLSVADCFRPPVFFCGNFWTASAVEQSRTRTEGHRICIFAKLLWALQHVLGLPHVVTQLASKRLVGQPSVLVPPSLQTTTLQKVQPSALRATWRTANSTRPTATNFTPTGALKFMKTAWARPARFFLCALTQGNASLTCQKRTLHVQ